eukprot:TRINITY_DN15576_c0_g1_i1.p2 TRINITY_DN15576_c0_g1~~TRINITY_DN15576_c0_g1_i1.p2  ORF type:complete len:241 (-),score=58.83 TRINITY_DN15576_c0_g1_i1:27-749(-)
MRQRKRLSPYWPQAREAQGGNENQNQGEEGAAAAAAVEEPRVVPDVIAAGLRVLFVGINPGLYSARVGHHFARPGNRFWPALQRSGLTGGALVAPADDASLLRFGVGITNIVGRATADAAALDAAELRRGLGRLCALVRRYRPRVVAVLGVSAYRTASGDRRAAVGRLAHLPASAAGGGAEWWLLPNPSGRNAHFTPDDFALLFRQVAVAAGVATPTARQPAASPAVANAEGLPPETGVT